MNQETKFDDEKSLVTFTLSGSVEMSHINELTKNAEVYLDRGLKCILDITKLEHIPTDVARKAVDIATEKFTSGFSSYCLVASGMFMLMISMLAPESFKRDHLASTISEAEEKLG
ncbi:MAG: hypothetical protein R2883_00050 [Caldisericia bacterium]